MQCAALFKMLRTQFQHFIVDNTSNYIEEENWAKIEEVDSSLYGFPRMNDALFDI